MILTKLSNAETVSLSLYISWMTLLWRHNGHGCVSNYQPHDCSLNCLFRHRSKKTSKLHITGLCVGNSPGTSEFPAQRASNAESVSIWWRHHGFPLFLDEAMYIKACKTWLCCNKLHKMLQITEIYRSAVIDTVLFMVNCFHFLIGFLVMA